MPVITTSYISPVGELILGSFQNKLCLCDWKSRQRRKAIDQKIASTLNEPFHQGMDSLLNLSMEQLNEYFAGERKSFDIPILECGSHFQKEVWKALRDIPYGTVMSYGQLAQSMGKPNSTRAVANANAAKANYVNANSANANNANAHNANVSNANSTNNASNAHANAQKANAPNANANANNGLPCITR